ncbi:MAG: chorismate-binding protein, partial [Burkholderiales bacterium]
LRLHSEPKETPEALFARMVEANKPRYSAYLDMGHFVICSASPELFFELEDGTLTSKPMKGTTGRGLWDAGDTARAQRLLNSAKDRAENLMIVDMVRNDLGRIARTGSVTVPKLFETERYPTLWQMTSTVQARSNASFLQILQALFPAASITGAPKARATQIIAELETTPRGVYTGCVGYLAPGGRARFNVAIRTAVADRDSNRTEYGLGSGIVWDSTSSAEYAECLLKARIVTDAPPPFELLETLLWEPGDGYFLLQEHLRRLRDSAQYLDVPADIVKVEAAHISDQLRA